MAGQSDMVSDEVPTNTGRENGKRCCNRSCPAVAVGGGKARPVEEMHHHNKRARGFPRVPAAQNLMANDLRKSLPLTANVCVRATPGWSSGPTRKSTSTCRRR